MSTRIEVAVFKGHKLVGRRSFEGGIVTVGAAEGCALRFVGVEGIEHSHALVWDDGGTLTIVASAGATIALNGKPVTIARPAADDIVTIGPLDLCFERRVGDAVAEESDDEPTGVHERPSRGVPEDAVPARRSTGDEGRDEEDDEDDEPEGAFLEPFSLVDQLTQSPGVAEGELTLQLVSTRGGRLTELATIDRGLQYMPALPRTLARHEIDGTAELSFGRGWSARTRPRATGDLVERPDGPGLLRFAVGGCAVLQNGDRTVLAFFIRRPRLAPEIGRRGIAMSALRHGAAATAAHALLGLVLVAAVTPEAAMSAGDEPVPPGDDVIDLYAVPPAPEPPPPIDAAREATPLPAERLAAAASPTHRPARATSAPAHGAPASSPRDASPHDALEQLEQSLTSSPAAGSLREALGAIDVAPSSGGATPGYRLALPVSAVPGLGLGRRGGGGPGGPLEVPLRNAAGAGRFGPPTPGDDGVRSLVKGPGTPPRDGPTIDRAAVQRVINQHQHQIVRCYERALLSSPGLAGTVRMAWVIAPGGRVSSVSVMRSTLGNAGVSSCMAAAIRGWQFPSPNGGPVTITFPWVVRPATQ